MNFLPAGYTSPTSNSGYFKIQDGENKIRILSSPIFGWLDWTTDKKPLRFRDDKKPANPIVIDKPIRYFWAFIVWDYSEKSIKIFEITQATIRKKLESLSKDSDWGSPFFYDVKIVKTGQKTDTEYEINPIPSNREISQEIKQAFTDKPIYLEELYRSGDPFTSISGRTPAFWESTSNQPASTEPVVEEEKISAQELAKIEDLIIQHIDPVDPQWRKAAYSAFKIGGFKDLKKRHFDLMMKRIDEKRKTLVDEEVPF